MTAPKRTTRPWLVQSEFETTIVDSMDNELAQVFARDTQEELEIARLMAAAPDLFEALSFQAMADADPAASSRKGYYEEAARLRRIAIAKATGSACEPPQPPTQAPRRSIIGFHISNRAHYFSVIDRPEVMIGRYYPRRRLRSGIRHRWYDLGGRYRSTAKLEIFDDAWGLSSA